MPEEKTYREMPNSLEAEQSVIGSMIMDKDAIAAACEIINEDDFYHKQYGLIFSAISELYDEGKPADLVVLQNKLREKNAPEEVCSLAFIDSIMDSLPSSVNIREYARIVAEKSLLRRVIRTNQEIENECFEGSTSVDAILQDT